MEKKAIEYDKIRTLTKNYFIFKKWKDIQYDIKLKQTEKFNKWRNCTYLVNRFKMWFNKFLPRIY